MAGRLMVFLLLVALTIGLPESEHVSEHCRLDTSDPRFYNLICENMTNEEQLSNEFVSYERPNSTWPRLVIANSHFRFIPHDALMGTDITEIEIVNCTIRSLSERSIAFQGLEESLESLYVTNTTFVNNWDWSHLRNISKLKRISVKKSDIQVLTDSMRRIPRRVNSLEFDEDGVFWIHPDAFSRLQELNTLVLPNNEIASIQRSMLPNPSKYMAYINLRGNRLANLPSNIFTNMPSLTIVDLSYNRFYAIEERIFGSIIGKLLHFDFRGNNLMCDCRIKWLSKIKLNPKQILATCTLPSYLKGSHAVGLAGVKLWC